MREILFALALADDHRPNAYDNNMDGCFKLECYLQMWLEEKVEKTISEVSVSLFKEYKIRKGRTSNLPQPPHYQEE